MHRPVARISKGGVHFGVTQSFPAGGLGGAVSPPAGPGAEPRRQTHFDWGPPEIIVYMVKIRAGFAVIDGITQFGCNLSGSACYNSYGGDMGGGGWFIWGGSYFLKRGVSKKGGSWEPPEPPLATGLMQAFTVQTFTSSSARHPWWIANAQTSTVTSQQADLHTWPHSASMVSILWWAAQNFTIPQAGTISNPFPV